MQLLNPQVEEGEGPFHIDTGALHITFSSLLPPGGCVG